MKKLILILLFCFGFAACEKDDICEGTTPTTSQMVIKFYNASNVIKKVTNLRVIAIGNLDTLVLNKAETGPRRFLLNDTILRLPLRITENATKYKFLLNARTPLEKTDEIQFNYKHSDIFVSRACGFKTIFDLNGTPQLPFVMNNSPEPSGNWIQSIQLLQPIIDNEKTTHIKIIF